MIVIHVRDREGREHEVEASAEGKLMEVLRELDYGVAALCGGMCSCATCHVYLDPAWSAKLPAPMEDEHALLADLSHRKSESRLSCQVDLAAPLDGLRVTVAPEE